MSKDLSIIILNYNTKKLLQNLLSSIFNSDIKKINLEVIVVDNASKDKSIAMVRTTFSRVKLIVNKNNLGYSKGNNIGAEKAEGKYLLFLNSDTKVFSNTLVKMLAFMEENKSAAAATCYLQLNNGKLDPACHRGFPTPWGALTYFSGLEKLFPRSRIFSQYHLGWKNLEKTHQVDVISGAFFMIRKEIFNKVNGIDEDYFMYGEDIDLCFRIKKLGYKIYYYPKTKIIHYKKQSGREKTNGKKITQKEINIRRITRKHFYETMKLFYDKNYQDKYPYFLRKLVLLGIYLVSKLKD